MENKQKATFAANHHIFVCVQKCQFLIKYKFTRFLKKKHSWTIYAFFSKLKAASHLDQIKHGNAHLKTNHAVKATGGGGNREA